MTEKQLHGRVALITGASRGLGKSMALALAAQGATIALAARDEAALAAVTAEVRALDVEAEYFLVDVASEASVLELERKVIERFGQLNILVNNAGMNLRKPVTDFTLEEWNRVINTNLTSAFLLCRSFVPHMKGKGYGRIINMTSIMSHVSLPGRIAYSTSKTGLLGMTRALALELAPENITVVGISPGPFLTEMNLPITGNPEQNAQFLANIPLNQWGQVQDIGALAAFICSEGGRFITGSDILIDGGWCAR
jgi:NAD(P)-dependent dehydrogenase (short-subunit alcohol dehydrogenase family)